MVSLNDKQVANIKSLIEAKGSEMEELTIDLLDHVCCMVEEKISEGSVYSDALQNVMQLFGKNGIQNIQDETTYLLTKNILAMKKTTHIIGILAAILLVVGAFFKIKHLPGAGAMYVGGGFLLSFIFLPLLFTIKVKEKISKLKIWTNLAGTLSGFLLINGAFFKVMHWPFANLLMDVGLGLLLLIFLPLYSYGLYKSKHLKSSTIINSVVIIGASCLLFMLVKVHNSKIVDESIINIEHSMHQNTRMFAENNDKTYQNLSEEDKNNLKKIQDKAATINSSVERIGINMVKSTGVDVKKNEENEVFTKKIDLIANKNCDLNFVREDLVQLKDNIIEYFKLSASVLDYNGAKSNHNFSIYLNEDINQFPLHLVMHDLVLMNNNVQMTQASILASFKTKVSQ